jgi:hypothetical protein
MNYAAVIERIYEHVENDHIEKAVMACVRLARNVEDYFNAAIFLRELYPDKQQFARVFYEDTAKLKDEAQKYLSTKSLDVWVESRAMRFSLCEEKEKNVLALGIGEMESEKIQLERSIQDMTLPSGMDPFDIAAFTDRYMRSKEALRLRIGAIQTIRARVKTRCLNYAISLERQLEAQKNADTFLDSAQNNVSNYFKSRSEDVFRKLQKASQTVASTEAEDRSLLLTKVRRCIKAVADHFYPARPEPVICRDGKERRLDDEKYLNRLEEYVAEEFPKGSAGELLEAEINKGALTAFVRRLNDISSKGVHADVPTDEARQGLIGLYMFLYNLVAKLEIKQAVEQR